MFQIHTAAAGVAVAALAPVLLRFMMIMTMMMNFLSHSDADAACDEMRLSTLNLASEFQTEYRTKRFWWFKRMVLSIYVVVQVKQVLLPGLANRHPF